MAVRIFMSGPIRPTEAAVRSAILSIRSEFPDARVSLCTWKTPHDTTKLQAEVDDYLELDEPQDDSIWKGITVHTASENRADLAPLFWPVRSFKMMWGVSALFEAFPPAEDDIVIRIRTDCIFRFSTAYRETLLQFARGGYCAWCSKMSGVLFSDWFGIALASTMKRAWMISSIEDWNTSLEGRYNPEDVVRVRLLIAGVQIYPLDMSKSEIYLLRSASDGSIEDYRPLETVPPPWHPKIGRSA